MKEKNSKQLVWPPVLVSNISTIWANILIDVYLSRVFDPVLVFTYTAI